LRGKPEFAAADGKGSVYVNNEDSSELHHLDAATLKNSTTGHWRLQIHLRLAMASKIAALFPVCDER